MGGPFKKFYFSKDVNIRVKMCRMMMQAATGGLLLDAVLRGLLIGFSPAMCFVPFLGSIITGTAFLLSLKLDFSKYGYFTILFISNILMLPVSFVVSGGSESGNPLWMALGVTMIFLLLDGWQFHIMLISSIVMDLGLFIFGSLQPEYIVHLEHLDSCKDSAVSLFIIIEILGLLFRYQNDLYEEERNLSEKRQNEIEEMSKAKSLFFANMSHEIRTPINTIIGLNEMTLRENVSDEVAENAVNIQNASKLLLTTVNDILDLSKLESGKMEIVPAQYETASLFSDLVNMVWVRAAQKGLDFRVDIDENIPSMLCGDEVRIKQVLTNILTNAVKYTEKGFVLLTAKCEEINPSQNHVRLKIAVEDTGIGIRKENIGELFTVFKQMDKQRNKKIEGTGLGLSIAKQLVDMMGGEIKVDSIYQKGSCFTVIIEQQIVDKAPPIGNAAFLSRKSAKDRGSYHQSFEAPDARVLVVDDNEMNLMVAAKLLRATKVQVDTAKSGQECLAKTRENNYHVILMDHMMPDMDGEETLNQLRARTDGYCQKTPVIALTANVMSNAAASYHNMGFDGYLAKPISGALLEAALRRALPGDLIEVNNVEEEQETDVEMTSIAFHNRKKKICISVDSICDLPKEWVRKLDIRFMHYYVTTEEGRFIDTKELNSDELLNYISENKAASSSCASVDEYELFFADRLMEAEQIIHISTASHVGEGWTNACQAADGFDNVTVIDSGHLSSGMGIMALYAAKLAEDGLEKDEILRTLNKLRDKINTSFIVPSGDNMYRNGKVSKMVVKICSGLQLRPVLCLRKSRIAFVGFHTGRMEDADLKYIRKVLRYSSRIDDRILFITYAGVPVKRLEKIKAAVLKRKKFDVVCMQKASSAISSNCGKGCFGLIFMKK